MISAPDCRYLSTEPPVRFSLVNPLPRIDIANLKKALNPWVFLKISDFLFPMFLRPLWSNNLKKKKRKNWIKRFLRLNLFDLKNDISDISVKTAKTRQWQNHSTPPRVHAQENRLVNWYKQFEAYPSSPDMRWGGLVAVGCWNWQRIFLKKMLYKQSLPGLVIVSGLMEITCTVWHYVCIIHRYIYIYSLYIVGISLWNSGSYNQHDE